jgi:cholesterol transport system auxiliary component
MSMPPLRRLAGLVTAALLLALPAACGGLLPKPPERQLYRLNPTCGIAPGRPPVIAQLAVETPTAPGGLDSRRIALTRSPLALDYFAGAEWSDQVPFLVRSALVDCLQRSGAIAAGPASLGLRADFVLETAIRDFEAAYDSSAGPPRVVIGLDVDLISLPERRLIAQAALKAEAPATANTVPETVRAFDTALGRAVTDAATWTLANPALSRRTGSLK